MSPLLLLLCSCLASLAATKTAPELLLPEHAEIYFESFIQKYSKQYVDEEEKQARLEIFKENLERANVLNQQSKHAVFGITQDSDLTQDEFVKKISCVVLPSNSTQGDCGVLTDDQIPNYNAPESHDWRQHNAVTRVKDQKDCGSCYSFSSSGNIEGQYAIKHGQLIELSEQQSVDCDGGSQGCHGGFMTSNFRKMIELGGIETEADYPYVDVQQTCAFTPEKAAVRLTDCTQFELRSQEKLKQLLFKNGPISIAVQATKFQTYNGGIISDEDCDIGDVNHAVLLVGYGTENGMPYWIIKNSWGTTRGEQGYVRIQRGEDALSCGMMHNGLMSSATIS